MEIIPVIDLMGGVVVHARGGERKQYKELQSTLTKHTEPKKVIADVLAFYPFKILYIADLDAIFDQSFNIELYQQISKRFPEVTFWLDAGIQTQQQWHDLNQISGIEPVIASESLRDLGLLNKRNRGVLSLDFQYGEFLGNIEILHQVEYWPNSIIVMNIDAVGGKSGPDFSLLKQIRDKRVDSDIIAAGGVRNARDLMSLEKENVAAVLIASALHNGEISVLEIQMLQK